MNRVDLHEQFIRALYGKIPKRAQLVSRIAETLHIEKESASRRLNGKVFFSVHEMGTLATAMDISLDKLLHSDPGLLWLPFMLQSPMKLNSMDSLCDIIHESLKSIDQITQDPAESGNAYSSLPLEFYMYYPALTKFMFFKWGLYFIGSEEFHNFSDWRIPERLTGLKEKVEGMNHFRENFYIWDNALILTLAAEIFNFHRMGVLTTHEKEMIRDELREMLTALEEYLKGNKPYSVFPDNRIDFYVSNVNMGFTCHYKASEKKFSVVFQTTFSHACIDNSHESFMRMKEWLKSLCNTSVLLSKSGHIERRIFFDRQHNILGRILG